MTPLAVELSVCIGVGGCGCPNSSSIFMTWTASLMLIKRDPNRAPATEDMTTLMICAMLRMAPFLGGMLLLVERGGKSSCSALYTWFAVITCVTVTCKNHVASIVRDDSVFLWCQVIE